MKTETEYKKLEKRINKYQKEVASKQDQINRLTWVIEVLRESNGLVESVSERGCGCELGDFWFKEINERTNEAEADVKEILKGCY